MAKRVVIIASGETERRALPHLAHHLQDRSVAVDEVRIPPRNRALNAQMAEKLIKAAWYENLSTPPDKFVVLMDVDQGSSRRSADSHSEPTAPTCGSDRGRRPLRVRAGTP